SDEFVELRPRIVWDRIAGTIRAREGAARVALTSGGTIPDRGLYGVFLVGAEPGKGRVGELDEEMVFETRVGETFLLGASTWRVEEITHDRVLVSPAPGVPGKMPFWKGETANRPLEFGRAIGALTRTLRESAPEKAMALLRERHDLDERAAKNLLEYLRDQHAAAGAVPDDKTILVERYLDEVGDWRVCVLTPFGGKVHAPWAMAIGAMVSERSDFEIDILWTDDGIVARFPEADRPPDAELVLPDPERAEALVIDRLGQTPLFAGRFREAAARALLPPRRYPGQRSPLWHQRRRAGELLQVAARFSSFPLILEAYRECLQDVFDMPALLEVLREIRSRDIRVVTVDSRTPSPFASALLFEYVGNFIYEGDAPLAERRAQALTVDPLQLRQLLGEAELRELLDADVLAELELQLQHLDPERHAKHPDGVHELLLRLGDLTRDEIAARTMASAPSSGPSSRASSVPADMAASGSTPACCARCGSARSRGCARRSSRSSRARWRVLPWRGTASMRRAAARPRSSMPSRSSRARSSRRPISSRACCPRGYWVMRMASSTRFSRPARSSGSAPVRSVRATG